MPADRATSLECVDGGNWSIVGCVYGGGGHGGLVVRKDNKLSPQTCQQTVAKRMSQCCWDIYSRFSVQA